jgi:hypothetical protein
LRVQKFFLKLFLKLDWGHHLPFSNPVLHSQNTVTQFLLKSRKAQFGVLSDSYIMRQGHTEELLVQIRLMAKCPIRLVKMRSGPCSGTGVIGTKENSKRNMNNSCRRRLQLTWDVNLIIIISRSSVAVQLTFMLRICDAPTSNLGGII